MTPSDIHRPDWLPTDIWPYDIKTCHVDDAAIAYTDEGDGDTLLLVHDGMWSFVWTPLIHRLREHMRVVTLDFPGSGLSPEHSSSPGLETDSILLERFVEHLGLTDITIGVHDLGGGVGLGMAVRRPELITAIVALNSFAWAPDTKPLRGMLAVMGSRPMRWLDRATGVVPQLSSTSFGAGRPLDDDARRAFRRGLGQNERFHDLMASALIEDRYLADVEARMRDTLGSKPLMTIFGERNDPFGFQERFRRHFDDVVEMVVPKGNHFPMSDAPDAVANQILAWHRSRVVDRTVSSGDPA